MNASERDALHQAIMNLRCNADYAITTLNDAYKFGHRDARHAAAELVTAYLAEHPADSDLPLTEEWLRSVGMHNTNTPTYWRFIGFDSVDIVKWSGGWNFRIHDGHNCKTRGDVRHLARALGIELATK